MTDAADRVRLNQYLPYKMLLVTSYITYVATERYARELGVTVAEARVITVIATFGPASTYEISERTRMDKPKVSRAIKQLTANGTVNRATNSEDRRLIVLTLTDKGRAINGLLAPIMHEIARDTFAVLDQRGKKSLEGALDQLIAQHDMSRVRL